MAKIIRIDHIALAVSDLDLTLQFWQETLGLNLEHLQDVPQENAENSILACWQQRDRTGLAHQSRHRAGTLPVKTWPGIHHICLEVDNLEEMLDHLKSKEIRLINEKPIVGRDGVKYAFIHPESTHGVLLELYQKL